MKRTLMACVWLCSTAFAQAQSGLPDGPGRPLVEKVCSKCHDLEGVKRSRNSKEGWSKIVDDMVSRGAEATDPEIEQIINYLTTTLGRKVTTKINVNKAPASELASTLALPADTAVAIVDYREKNGAFKEWQDLAKVPGLDLTRIADKKDRVEF